MTRIALAHIGIYCSDLERMREFYVRYFNGVCGPKYTNPTKGFASYMISFGEIAEAGQTAEGAETGRAERSIVDHSDTGENPHAGRPRDCGSAIPVQAACRLELMTRESVTDRNPQPALGLTHLAFGMADETAVNALTKRLRADGYTVLGEPRRTGDGYYESVVADPEGNHVEITA